MVGIALGVQVSSELLVVGAGDDTLFIEEGEDSCVFAVNEVEDFLIVGEGDKFPEDAFAFVLVLLQFEDVFVELLLERLVGVVDADLLEVVRLEGLKAEDVEDTD